MRGLPTILPTTKQVVGNGHLQTDLDGKNKKALYFQCSSQGNTGLLRHSWTGKKTIRCFGSAHASVRLILSDQLSIVWYQYQSI